MPFRTRRALAVFVLAATATAAPAEEYDITVVFKDEAPVMVPFFKCLRNALVAATDETLPVCKDRERDRDRDRTFNVPAARITNLGTSVIWVHFGTAKLPVMPGKVYRRTAAGGGTFDHVFISGTPDGVAHVFASSSGADEPEAPTPKAPS
jgi:hypothetical protein